ncbi:MAG: Imm21 family immunity protein [Myxococcota bacterium]|nr:Imm21 family immunity protein [Myxococcota bacterium]
MPAAVAGTFKLVGSHHWTSGPVAIVPAALHARWVEAFTDADGKAIRKLKKRASIGPEGGVFFPKFGVVGMYQRRGVTTFVEAHDEDGRYPTPLEPILRAATQVEVDAGWKHVASYRLAGPHVLANVWSKDTKGAASDRKRKSKLALKAGDYVIEELRGVKHSVQPQANKRALEVSYSFTRIRPAGEAPRATKAKHVELGPTELVATPEVVKASKKLKFVDNDQTCSVVMPRAVLHAWSGHDEKPDGTTDFWRACAVRGVGFIDVAGAKALVIGSDYAAAFYPTAKGGMLVLWSGADSAAGVLANALSIPDAKWKKQKAPWRVTDGVLVLIGAPTTGSRAKTQRCNFELAPGTYELATCWGHAADVRVGKRVEESGASAIRFKRR